MKGLKVFVFILPMALMLGGCVTQQPRMVDVPVTNGIMHTVLEGETLYAIANTYEVTPELIKRVNSLKNPDEIAVGTRLFIPAAEDVRVVEMVQVAQVEQVEKQYQYKPDGLYHTVAPGETLIAIARAYQVTVRELERSNSIHDASTLQIGQRLWIPRAKEVKDVQIKKIRIASSTPILKKKDFEPVKPVSKTAEPVTVVKKTEDPRVETVLVHKPDSVSNDAVKKTADATETKPAPKPTEVDFPREVSEYGPGRFQWPVKDKIRVLRQFSTSSENLNSGIDLGVDIGSPVSAAADGEVQYVGSVTDDLGSSFGNYIIIYHGENNKKGVRTIYAHNSENMVEIGQKVKRGEQIARAGNTGRPVTQNGGVLHFEIRELDTPLNPAKILPPLK